MDEAIDVFDEKEQTMDVIKGYVSVNDQVEIVILFIICGKITSLYLHMFYLFISRKTKFIIDNVGQISSGMSI